MGNKNKVSDDPIIKCVECGKYAEGYTCLVAACAYCGEWLCEHCHQLGIHTAVDQLAGRKPRWGNAATGGINNARIRWCV